MDLLTEMIDLSDRQSIHIKRLQYEKKQLKEKEAQLKKLITDLLREKDELVELLDANQYRR